MSLPILGLGCPRVPIMSQWLRNQNRNQEVAHWIPRLAQWVNNQCWDPPFALEVALVMAIRQKKMWCVQNRDWFAWQKFCTQAHCQPGDGQRCSDMFLDAESVRYEESHLPFLNPKSRSSNAHILSKSKRPDCTRWSAAENMILAKALTWMWLKSFTPLSEVRDHIDHSTHELVNGSPWCVDNGKSL